MEISLVKLRHLVTVAKTQNLSRAAELLHISQPALSRTIAEIERAYGVSLFDRSRSGMRLTAAGAQVIADAETVLRNARTFDHNLKLLGEGSRGTVDLGLGPAIATLVLAQLASSILRPPSSITMRTVIRPLEALLPKLMDETIELLVSLDPMGKIPSEIEAQKIGVLDSAFCVRFGHPLANRGRLTIEDILNFPLACQEEPTPLLRYGHNLNVLVCDNYRVMYEFMLLNDAVCLCPRQIAALDIEASRLAMLDVVNWKSRQIPIFAGWHRGRTLSPIASQIVETSRTYFAAAD